MREVGKPKSTEKISPEMTLGRERDWRKKLDGDVVFEIGAMNLSSPPMMTDIPEHSA